MKIAKYISNLLFEYECIVIPGLGGFITKEIPASIHPTQHSFSPPSKEVVFNIHLKTNDGLLINHLAQSENISYTDSKLRVDNFVNKCKTAFEKGKKIRFHKIGVLYKNDEENIQFEPDKSQNYLADSFGLTSFISPAIKRETTRQKIEKKFKDRKAAPEKSIKKTEVKDKGKNPKYIKINVFGLLLFIAVVAFCTFKFNLVKDYYNNYAGFIPFFYPTPHEYVVDNLSQIPLTNIIPLIATHKATSVDLSAKPEQKKKDAEIQAEEVTENILIEPITEEPKTNEISIPTEETEIIEKIKPEDYKFFIIAGSFKVLNNAEKLIHQLNAKGYNAGIVGQNKYDFYRVCFNGYINRNEAEQQLAIIRKEENPEAWILVK